MYVCIQAFTQKACMYVFATFINLLTFSVKRIDYGE